MNFDTEHLSDEMMNPQLHSFLSFIFESNVHNRDVGIYLSRYNATKNGLLKLSNGRNLFNNMKDRESQVTVDQLN
jgi:hypothetical protein